MKYILFFRIASIGPLLRLRAFVVAAVLAGSRLVSSAGYAQTRFGQDALPSEPSSLQVGTRPAPEGASLWVYVRNQSRGAAHIVLQDQNGTTVYDGYDTSRKFKTPFDFGSMAPGSYTIEVSTATARHRQTFRVELPVAGRIAVMEELTPPLADEVAMKRH